MPALVLVVALAGWAQQVDPVAVAAAGLREDPVYVDPGAEQAPTEAEAGELRDEIRSAGRAIFVAVLPASAGEAEQVAGQLVEETGLSGTYAIVVGDSFRATSTELAGADELATAAFQGESDQGTVAVLRRFVQDVAEEPAGETGGEGAAPAPQPQPGDGSGDEGDEGGGLPVLPIALLAGGGAVLWVWSRRRRREREERRAQRRADVEMLRAEMAVLSDDVLRLEPEVALRPEARDDYEAAVGRHRVASAALEHADDQPIDLVRIERVLAEARWAMARARARVDGREPPPPPDELRRPGRHDEPPLDVDEQGAPVYAGGQPFYGGGGWFGGGVGSGLFGGLLLGSMLGGWGWGGPVVIDHGDGGDGGGSDGGWGGDWGGGDWGGGDWGGGDFGGGDFGGGDFGG